MKKNAFSRYICFLLLYCGVFILLVVIQFTRTGNFNYRIGDMQISGRYSIADDAPETARNIETVFAGLRPDSPAVDFYSLDGAASVYFSGLEFKLASQPRSGRNAAGSVFSLTDTKGDILEIFPEYVFFPENEAVFILPGGSILSFSNINSELRISAQFGQGVSGIDIPFNPYRASAVNFNDDSGFAISFSGKRYGFNRAVQNLNTWRLNLSDSAPSVSYRVLPDKIEVKIEDFVIPQTENRQVFTRAFSQWTGDSFTSWRQNIYQADEDIVIAWSAEALRRGGYGTGASIIPASFSGGNGRTHESSVYQFDRRTGIWERSVRNIHVYERDKTNRITRMLQNRDTGVFTEKNLIEYLAMRGLNNLIDEAVSLAAGMSSSEISQELYPGIFESKVEINKRRPGGSNPFEQLAEAVCLVIADALKRDGDRVFVFSGQTAGLEYNIRLGTALEAWAGVTEHEDWAQVGRSLVLSVIASAANDGSVPVSVSINPEGEFVPSTGRIGSARLYRLLGLGDYSPRWVETGIDGILIWTAASPMNLTRDDRQMVLTAGFPAGETHYIMLTNIRPFAAIQIGETNWRRATDFESYFGSSGWNYFPQEQTLVIKLRHRSQTERVRILFNTPAPSAPRPQPAPPPSPPVDD